MHNAIVRSVFTVGSVYPDLTKYPSLNSRINCRYVCTETFCALRISRTIEVVVALQVLLVLIQLRLGGTYGALELIVTALYAVLAYKL